MLPQARRAARRTLIVPVIAALLTGSSAAAQIQLTGRVLDDRTGEPLDAAYVVLLSRDSAELAWRFTDSTGVFTFTVEGRDAIRLRVERIGYQRTVTPALVVTGYEAMNVNVRVDEQAVLLAPLEVVARSAVPTSPVLREFRRRLERGNGVFITRDDIERQKPSQVTELLGAVPGIRFSGGRGGRHRTVVFERAARPGSRECPAQIFLDGLLLNGSGRVGASRAATFLPIDDAVSPNDIVGIEIYSGISSVPPEFGNPNADCGVIAIWTRRGG